MFVEIAEGKVGQNGMIKAMFTFGENGFDFVMYEIARLDWL